MVSEVKVPRISVNDDFVELVEWHVTDGSTVTEGSLLCTVETSKTTFEIEAERNGIVKILASEGERLPVLETICLLYDDGEELSGTGPDRKPTVDRSESPEAAREATRKAVELAERLGVDLQRIDKDGVIREKDVRDFHTANLAEPATSAETAAAETPSTVTDGQSGQGPLEAAEAVTETPPSRPDSPAKRAKGAIRSALRQLLRAAMWLLYRVPVLSSLTETLVRTFPPGRLGTALRTAYYRNGLMHLGERVRIDTNALLLSPEAIGIGDLSHIDTNVKIVARSAERPVRIGKGVHIGSGVLIYGTGGVTIGDYAAVAAGSIIYSARNLPEMPGAPGRLISMSHAAPKDRQYFVREPVVIEDYVFIGLNVSILPGVTIGRGSIVNSGAVVANDIPPYSIFGGPTFSVVGERQQKLD